MENEGEGASPAEQLAAEVANDQSQEGDVTADDVAEVLHLPKHGKSEESADTKDKKDGEGSGDDSDGDDDNADGSDDDADASDDDEEVEEDDSDDDQDHVVTGEDQQFTLTVKDANGKEFTLQPGDDLEKVLEDFEPKSNGQIFSILQQLQKLEVAKEQYEADQEKQQQDAAYQDQVKTIRSNWDKEIEALQGDKRIPVSTDGKVPARVNEVFKFMQAENDKRLQDGRPLLQSFEDALDKLEFKESKDGQAKKDKEEKELARKRGAVVGGSSAATTSSSVSPYRRGARSATAALRQMGILR